jgi:asparagine synthase (glutamine-hydrolysing)
MCGIAGVVARDARVANPAVVDGLAAAIRYRGRDAEGRWADASAVLLHARLAIMDPEHGAQPMVDASGRYVIAFGGEIHNHDELRRRYEAAGARFRTHCDTEVVLEGFKLRGPAVCDDAVGMFSIAIWDVERRELFLARDRLGEKPLYWSGRDGAVWFSSTCDAFRHCPGWTGALSQRGLAEYSAAGSFRWDRTIYHDVRALPPGTWAVVRPGDESVVPQRYWQLQFRPDHGRSVAETRLRYDEILSEAVDLRLGADVPVAITFSGGVDSGTVAAMAAASGRPFPCFTFDHDSPGDRSEETDRAREVAALLGMPWRFCHYDYRATFPQDLGDAYAAFDQPSWQPELVHLHQVATLIRPSAPVALTGGGADELFNGYRGDERLRRLDLVRSALTRLGARAALGDRLDPVHHLAARMRIALAGGPVPDARAELELSINELRESAAAAGAQSALDLKTFHTLTWSNAESLYRAPDIAGLSAGVEFRAPFLDHRVVEFATTLPAHMRVRRPWTAAANKWIAKERYAEFVGHDVAYAPKLNMGANLFWDLELGRSAWRGLVDEALDELDTAGLDTSGPRRAWSVYVSDVAADRAPSTYTLAIRWLMLGLWLRRRPSS